MTQPITWCDGSTLRSAALFAIFFRADDIRCTAHRAAMVQLFNRYSREVTSNDL